MHDSKDKMRTTHTHRDITMPIRLVCGFLLLCLAEVGSAVSALFTDVVTPLAVKG